MPTPAPKSTPEVTQAATQAILNDVMSGAEDTEPTYEGMNDDGGGDIGIAVDEDAEDPGVEADAEGDVGEGEGADGEGESDSEESDATGEAAPPAKLDVEVGDGDDRKTVSLDLSDTDKLKRIVQRAYGAQKGVAKVQAELKTAKGRISELESDAEVGSKLSKAWDEGGIDGVIRTLTGGKQTWDSVYEDRKKHDHFLSTATPDQIDAFNAKEEARRAKADADAAKKQFEDFNKKSSEREEAAERAELQSHMDVGFEKYRFSGKLGDESREHRLDRLLWNGVRAELAELPDDTVVTPRLVASLFAEHASAIRSTVQAEARKETTNTVKQKAREAKTQAQAAMASAQTPKDTSFNAKMKAGDFKGAFLSALRGGAR